MQATQIQIAAIAKMPVGKSPGTIVDTNGVEWKIFLDKFQMLANKVGQSVAINYKTDEWPVGSGRQQHTIIGLAGTASGLPPAPPRQATPAPAAPAGFVNPAEKDENIAVLALVKEWMSKIPVGDIAGVTHALRTCRAAWREFKKTHAAPPVSPPNPKPPLREALNDEIPEFDESGKSIDEMF